MRLKSGPQHCPRFGLNHIADDAIRDRLTKVQYFPLPPRGRAKYSIGPSPPCLPHGGKRLRDRQLQWEMCRFDAVFHATLESCFNKRLCTYVLVTSVKSSTKLASRNRNLPIRPLRRREAFPPTIMSHCFAGCRLYIRILLENVRRAHSRGNRLVSFSLLVLCHQPYATDNSALGPH